LLRPETTAILPVDAYLRFLGKTRQGPITMISVPIARPAIPLWMCGAIPLVGAGVAVTALADWLFYRHQPGISVAIFLAALCAAALLTNPVRANRIEFAAATAVLAAALVPTIEDFGLLSLVFAVAGTSVFALLTTGWPARPAVQRLTDVGWMVVSGPFRLAADLGRAIHEARRRDIAKLGASWLMAWIVPVGLGGLFLLLFSQANPLIEQWFTSVNTSYWTSLDLVRPLFWIGVIALIHPLIF
jgi:hypothetical protein